MTDTITLDGESLTIEQLVRIARDPSVRVEPDSRTNERVARSEALIAQVVENYRAAIKAGNTPATEYGVTTGFGEFKDKPIAPDDLEQLQRNLLLSHSAGVGENSDPDDLANYFPAEVVRGALATRLNAFLKGYSGVRRKLVEIVQAMLNRGVIPLVPIRGSVGASGDLCPLSHLFVVLLGVGRFYVVGRNHDLRPATELPSLLGFSAAEMLPTFKEGLALVNGANFSAAMLALAVDDAARLANAADTCAAMTLEAITGCARALDPKVHEERGHPGQIASAANIRALVASSKLVDAAGAVQDAYSIRCAPQVHGAARDAIAYVREVAAREINAATDNPLFFPENGAPFDVEFRANWPEWYRCDQRLAYSAGNFHGEPLAMAADFLAIAVAELGSISERRTQTMLDGHHNRGLPQNLTTRPGVNSGLMIAQYTAASIVSENKVLAHPASVDSIPTSANAEDHVSMSTHAARKALTIIGNVQSILAIELMVAAQAIEWRAAVRGGVGEAHTLEEAERQAAAFEKFVRSTDIAGQLGRGTKLAYRAVRERVSTLHRDHPLDGDVRQLRDVVMSLQRTGKTT
ncbi:MAG: histidine ammonia-lyase [Thermoanaerobaculia bacterium]